MGTITIKDIAKYCGVGVSTVSRAMNGHSDISEETRERVMAAIKALGYIPNNSARNLKRSESNTIAVLIKGIENPFFQSMFNTFEQELNNTSYDFILHRIDAHEDELQVALALEKEKRLKGIIFLGGSIIEKEAYMKHLTVPFVLCTTALGDRPWSGDYTAITVDDVRESYRITDYLCRLGHKKIAIIGGREDEPAGVGMLRIKGYKAALMDHGITPDPDLILYMDPDIQEFTPANGYAVTKRLLESGKDFTALFVVSDSTAFGACKAILETGKRIPEDYSVAGFDGIELARYYHPSLTTMHQPGDEMARESIKLLIDMIEGDVRHQMKIFDAELVVGESTGDRGRFSVS